MEFSKLIKYIPDGGKCGCRIRRPEDETALKDPRCDRPCYGKFPHSLAEFFLQEALLLFVQTKAEDPELVQ
jgi:hypothetical protein